MRVLSAIILNAAANAKPIEGTQAADQIILDAVDFSIQVADALIERLK